MMVLLVRSWFTWQVIVYLLIITKCYDNWKNTTGHIEHVVEKQRKISRRISSALGHLLMQFDG